VKTAYLRTLASVQSYGISNVESGYCKTTRAVSAAQLKKLIVWQF